MTSAAPCLSSLTFDGGTVAACRREMDHGFAHVASLIGRDESGYEHVIEVEW